MARAIAPSLRSQPEDDTALDFTFVLERTFETNGQRRFWPPGKSRPEPIHDPLVA